MPLLEPNQLQAIPWIKNTFTSITTPLWYDFLSSQLADNLFLKTMMIWNQN